MENYEKLKELREVGEVVSCFENDARKELSRIDREIEDLEFLVKKRKKRNLPVKIALEGKKEERCGVMDSLMLAISARTYSQK
jgi:hypothetical protein